MDNRLRKIIIGLAILGLLVSIYMTIFKLTNNEAMCIGSGGCSVVNASRYSEVNGIPVALIGVGGYAAILALLFLEQRPGFFQENGTMMLFGISLVGFLFTLYLIVVEVFFIKAYCPFCLTSQAVMTIIFILSVTRLVKQPQFQEDLNAPY
ncbi:MAG TPA: vitamin K epoxide reductase family protein [Anaerolineales bacterium]|nr:vitamin K epoxide reductase family protein [Anaerolineales bacterium]